MIDIIQKIESRYPVNTITCNGIQVWPLLRFIYFMDKVVPGYRSTTKFSFVDVILDFFYGFSNFFRKYDYFVFSSKVERKIVNGLYHDKLFDTLIDCLGADKTLYIENPNSPGKYHRHYPHKNIKTKRFVSDSFLTALSAIYQKCILIH